MKQELENILSERIVALEHAYEQKIAELSLLKELGETLKITSISTWEDLFSKQLEIVKHYTGIYSISLMVLDETKDELYIVGASELFGAKKRKAIRLKRGEGVAGKVIDNVRTIYLTDVCVDQLFADKGTGQKGSLACVPIISEGKCIGVINFRDSNNDAFTINDIRFFELIADQLSITVSLVKSYKEVITLEKKRINLSRYFSRGLAERLVANEGFNELSGEIKPVTVLFADITEFTPMIEKYNVKDVVEILNRYFESVVPCIFEFGGMLDKFLGDGFMAVFGIPFSDQRDVIRSIECAVKIQLKVKKLNKALIKEGFKPIDVGVGIASGNALAGNIGTNEHMNYTVIGEPVNMAQRLESIAANGEIIVSETTYKLACGFSDNGIIFEPMPKTKIKGISRDVFPAKVLYHIG
jgi:adenylate cyclase